MASLRKGTSAEGRGGEDGKKGASEITEWVVGRKVKRGSRPDDERARGLTA